MKDGRLITKEDKVVGAQYLENGFTIFCNADNFARICTKTGDIIFDFDEKVLYNKVTTLTDIILTVDENNCFKIRDFQNNILYSKDNILDFDASKESILLTKICADGTMRKVGIDYDYRDILTETDGVINCKISSNGIIFIVLENGETYLFKDNYLFDHGYKQLLDVVFLDNSMLVTGIDNKNKITTLVIHNDYIADCLPGTIYGVLGYNGELQIIAETEKRKDMYLYNKEGQIIEHFVNGEGNIYLEPMGALCVNKKGYCQYILADGSVLYNYKEKYGSVVCLNENFQAASPAIARNKIEGFLKPLSNVEVEVLDTNHLIPEFYLKNSRFIMKKGGFILIYRTWNQEHQYINDDGLLVNGYTPYSNVIVLNLEGKLITNRLQESLEKVSVIDTVMANDEVIAFYNRDNSISYFDINGNEYVEEPIILAPENIYLKKDEYFITYSLPNISKEEVQNLTQSVKKYTLNHR